MEKKNQLLKRIVMSILGIFICSFSVSMFKIANFGVDPFQCFLNGLLNIFTNISYGNLSLLVNIILFIIIFITGRNLIGIATFVNTFFFGYIVEIGMVIIKRIIPEPGILARIILLLLAIVIMCLASAFYFTADLGVSAYDAVALTLAGKKIAPFKYLRIGTDLICVIVGIIGLAMPGVGTLITAFFMGPLIDFFKRKIAEPFLHSYKLGFHLMEEPKS